MAALIRVFKKCLPGCVKEVILRGDGEFISWEAVKAAREEGFHFIFGNKVCAPPFASAGWYKVRKNDAVEYNEVLYPPAGWGETFRFVGMRIPPPQQHRLGEMRRLNCLRMPAIHTGYPSRTLRRRPTR